MAIDETMGFISSCILERLQGRCDLYFLHESKYPNLGALPKFNFSEDIKSSIKPLLLKNLTESELNERELKTRNEIEEKVDSYKRF